MSGLSVTYKGMRYDCVGGVLYVSDHVEHDQYNHPELLLNFAVRGIDESEIHVAIEFQRDTHVEEHQVPARGVFVTKRPWSWCYSGHVQLATNGNKVRVRSGRHTHSAADEVRLLVARRLAETLQTRPYLEDEGLAVLDALEVFGLKAMPCAVGETLGKPYIKVLYQHEQGGTSPLETVMGDSIIWSIGAATATNKENK